MIRPFFYVSLKATVNREVTGKQGVHLVSPENSWAPSPYQIVVLILFM